MIEVKINEIKIGNWFNYYDTEEGEILGAKLSSFSSQSDVAISINGGGYTRELVSRLKPIILTEEWILKLGYSKEKTEGFYFKDKCSIWAEDGSFSLSYGSNKCIIYWIF